MRQILERSLDKVIKEKEFTFDFDIEKDGLYGIEIVASCKSWRQKLTKPKTFFDDDDLTIKIDGIKFPKLSGSGRLFDSEVSYNGNKLKGLRKTDLFLIRLGQGKHALTFLADQSPKLETIRVYGIGENEFEITYLPKDNFLIEDGNRRPWLTIILFNISLARIRIKASAKEVIKKDDSDLKLVVNGKTQKNQEPKSHRSWYWCGRVLKGRSKVFSSALSLGTGVHYIELWADRSPLIEEIKLIFKKLFKRIPTASDPKWTGRFLDDPDEILLARLVFGEARGEPRETKIWIAGSILNRVKAKAWPNTIKDVIIQRGQYDPFKPSDKNYRYIIDPLKETSEKVAWQESYEVARDIILGKIKNSTVATHFHGIGVSKDWFLKNVVPRGKFLRKIRDTYFYWSLN